MSEIVKNAVAKVHKAWIKRETTRFLEGHRRLRTLLEEIDRQSESVGLSNYKYVSLYQMVKKTRPDYVLECGTGKSTFVIAQAMCENGNGIKLVSLEEFPDNGSHGAGGAYDSH